MSAVLSQRVLWWVMVFLVGCYLSLFVFFPGLFLFVGVNHFGVWFLDTYAILATNDAMSAGISPYAFNPLDPFGRSHAYTHWWLHLRDFGLTRADNFALGASFVLAFFVTAIARLRPRTVGELLWYLAIFCSSPILLAINRANNDLLIFVLFAPLVPWLLSPRRSLRLASVLLIALGASLKFYPAVGGLLLLAGDDAREVRGRVIFGLIALALVAVNLSHDLAMLGTLAPKAEGIMTFGAVNLLTSLGVSGWGVPVTVAVIASVIFAGFWRSRIFVGWKIAVESRGAWWSFVLAAVLLTGCFFTGRNFAYRWIFALWMAPWLWQLMRDPLTPVAVRRLAWTTATLLMLALWFDPALSAVLGSLQGRVPGETILRWADRAFLYEQPIIWTFFACLLGFLAHFTRQGVRTLLNRG